MSAPKDKGTLKPTQAPEMRPGTRAPAPRMRCESVLHGPTAPVKRRTYPGVRHPGSEAWSWPQRPEKSDGTWYQTPSSAIHFSSCTDGDCTRPTFGSGTSTEYVTRTFTRHASSASQAGS